MANTPVSATIPTVVYTPPASGYPHSYLYNQGPSPVYLGGSGVSTVTGLPLGPGDRVEMPNTPSTVYAVSGFSQISPSGSVATATTAGGTTITVATFAAGTVFTSGMWIVVEPGTPRQETAQVNGNGGTVSASVYTSGPLTYVHAAGTSVLFQQITATPSSVFNPAVGAT